MPHHRLELKVSALIFDMDGVITDTMPYHMRAWKAVFASVGVIASREDIYKREGQKGIDSVREIFAERNKEFTEKKAQKLLLDKEELFKVIFKRKFIAGSKSFVNKF
jgi:beta-phosphoglucomutase-like phosphatase (HAD superfamily)